MLLTRIAKLLWVAAVIVFASSCTPDALRSLINKQFPQVSLEEQRTKAISSAVDVLKHSNDQNLAAGFSLSALGTALDNNPVLTTLGVKTVKLTGKKQFIDIQLGFDFQFDSAVVPIADEKLRALLDKAKPHVVGTMEFGSSISSSIAQGEGTNLTLNIALLPYFHALKVDKLTVETGDFSKLVADSQIDVTVAAKVVVDVVNAYSANISRALSDAKFASIKIPASPFSPTKLSKSVSISDESGAEIAVALRSQLISAPVFLESIVWLVDEDRLSVMSQLSNVDKGLPLTGSATESADFQTLRNEFRAALKKGFSLQPTEADVWVAISKALLAKLINSAFEQGQPCLHISANLPENKFSKKIDLPSEDLINCTPTLDCTSTIDCRQTENCEQNEDCRACLARAPRVCTPRICAFGGCVGGDCSGGQCIQHGLDPTCQLRKAKKKAECEAQKVARKTACEADKAAKKLVCETKKTAQKTACEGAKAAVKAISQTGKFANVDGSVSGKGSLNVCFKKVDISQQLDKIQIGVSADGDGSVDAMLKFTPLDIVGHLTCQVPWKEQKNIHIGIPTQLVTVDSVIKMDETMDPPRVSAMIETSGINIELRPSPRDLILKSFNMTLACAPVAPLLHQANLTISPFIPEMNGNIKLPGQSMKLEFDLKPIELERDGATVSLSMRKTSLALVLAGTLVSK